MARLIAVSALLVAAYAIATFLVSINVIENRTVALDEMNSNQQGIISRKTGRFPQYGTDEFQRLCNWTVYPGNKRNCVFSVKPPPEAHEGIGSWIPGIVTGQLLALQAGCDIKFDYGPGIDLADILLLPSGNEWNWTMSLDYNCRKDARCVHDLGRGSNVQRWVLDGIANKLKLDRPLAYVPVYRFAHSAIAEHQKIYKHHFNDLQRAIPGFEPETGMACSVESLFHLSPKAAQFEPELYSRILPTLNREDSLVMSLYIRTGEADKAAVREKAVKQGEANATEGEDQDYREEAKYIVDCALQQEREHLEQGSYDRVVWMVVSDSVQVKKWIAQSYGNTQNAVPREIVTTRARGVHSRAARGPSTVDFAEALIDWYLIGESDLVITGRNSPSFGGTAALRTARPFYNAARGCVRTVAIHVNTTQDTQQKKHK